MNEYEKVFIARMARLQTHGYDFEQGARSALEAKFGGGVDVFLDELTARARQDPEEFVRELGRKFGRGAMGFLGPIVRYGDDGKFPPARVATPYADELAEVVAKVEHQTAKTALLHDVHIQDVTVDRPDSG